MRNDDSGYTLTDVVMVAALAGLCAAIAIPRISTVFHSWQLYADSRGIATALVSGKLQAVSRATQYQINFTLNNRTWTPQRFNRTSGAFENDGSPVTLSNGVSNSGIQFQNGSTTPVPGFPSDSSVSIRFNSRGIPITPAGIPTGSNVVYLTDGQTSYAITVSLLGRVELWRRNGGSWVSQ